MDRGDLDDRLQEKQALLRQAEANYQSKKEESNVKTSCMPAA